MQTEEQQQFRLNWQVFAVVIVTLLAMAIPLAGVAFLLKAFLVKPQNPPAAAATAVDPGLEKALEDISVKTLGRSNLATDSETVALPVRDVPAAKERVMALAGYFGGVAIPMEGGADSQRLLAWIPEQKAAAFVSACKRDESPRVPETKESNATNNEARALIEIHIQKKRP